MKPLLLITGVSGRLGSAAAALFSKSYQVIGLDIYPAKVTGEAIEYIFTDISSLENIKDSLNQVREKYGNRIASVLHLAAYYNFEGGSWDQYQEITINGTANLLEALADFEVEQFVFSSTLLVYAPCRVGEKIREDSPINPKWEYPRSKIETEQLIHERRNAIPTVILRIAGVYTDACDSIPISQHLTRVFEKHFESHFFPGNLHHGATFLHIQDLMQAFENVVEKRNLLKEEELFVLGEPVVMSYQDLQHEMGMLLHKKPWWTIRIPKWMAKLGIALQDHLPFLKKTFIRAWMIDLADDHYDVGIEKAIDILGWKPVHSLKTTLPQMVGELKKDPKKWLKNHEF